MTTLRAGLYQSLSPVARARALLEALARRDSTECDRLLPTDSPSRRAILLLSHGLGAVAYLTESAAAALWYAIAEWRNVASWVDGYVSAGGDPDSADGREQVDEAERLWALVEDRVAGCAAAAQAIREWCEREGLNTDAVGKAQPLSMPLSVAWPAEPDERALAVARAMFEPIRLG